MTPAQTLTRKLELKELREARAENAKLRAQLSDWQQSSIAGLMNENRKLKKQLADVRLLVLGINKLYAIPIAEVKHRGTPVRRTNEDGRSEKRCPHCRTWKPLHAFRFNNTTGRIASWCKDCEAARARLKRKEDKK